MVFFDLALPFIISLCSCSPPELSALATPPRKDAKMLVLLAGIFVVHIATVIMLFVSTIANVSRDHPGGETWGLLPHSAAVAHHAGRWVLRSVDERHLLASKSAMQ